MKLRSLILALLIVFSATAMADPCTETVDLAGFRIFDGSWKNQSKTVKIGDLNRTTPAALIDATDKTLKLWNNIEQAVSMGLTAKKAGTAVDNAFYTNTIFTNSYYITSVNGKQNIPALVNAVGTVEAKVKACEAVAADDDLVKWKREFSTFKKDTDSPLILKSGSIQIARDMISVLRDLKTKASPAKIAELDVDNFVTSYFVNPCFNASFKSVNLANQNKLLAQAKKSTKAGGNYDKLQATYTLEEITTILDNADYYNDANFTKGGTWDNVSLCALTWMICAYNKTAASDDAKKKALADLLFSKFGMNMNNPATMNKAGLLSLSSQSVPYILASLNNSTNLVFSFQADYDLIDAEIQKLPGYTAPVVVRTASEINAWIESNFNADASTNLVTVDYTNMEKLVSKNLLKVDPRDVSSVVAKVLSKFGAKGDYNTNKAAIEKALNDAIKNKTAADVEKLINAIIHNTSLFPTTDLLAGVSSMATDITSKLAPATKAPQPQQPAPTGPTGNPPAKPTFADQVNSVATPIANKDELVKLLKIVVAVDASNATELSDAVDALTGHFGFNGAATDHDAAKLAIEGAIKKAIEDKKVEDLIKVLEANIALGFTSAPADLAAIQAEVFPPASTPNPNDPNNPTKTPASAIIKRLTPIDRVWRKEANVEPTKTEPTK